MSRHTLPEVLDYYREGWHIPPRDTLAVQFLIADLLEHYARLVDRDVQPMLNTAVAMFESRTGERLP